MHDKITYDNWAFYDKTRTSAEIVRIFTRQLKKAQMEQL
jgi:hypothetical protein